jgi:hypothetical protein
VRSVVLSGSYHAVVDRERGSVLVVVLEADGDPVDELAVDPSTLPESVRHVGADFSVDLAAGRLVDVDTGED